MPIAFYDFVCECPECGRSVEKIAWITKGWEDAPVPGGATCAETTVQVCFLHGYEFACCKTYVFFLAYRAVPLILVVSLWYTWNNASEVAISWGAMAIVAGVAKSSWGGDLTLTILCSCISPAMDVCHAFAI